MMTQIVLEQPGGPGQLTARPVPVPDPGPRQVLVRTEAAGVAFNDVTTRQGRNPGRLPRVLGFDAAGRVTALGSQVTALQKGQRVAALLGTGGYSAYVVAAAGHAVPTRRTVAEAAGGHWLASAAGLPAKVDAVFDPVGGPSLRRSRQVTRAGGVVVSSGFSFTVDAGHSTYGGLVRTVAA